MAEEAHKPKLEKFWKDGPAPLCDVCGNVPSAPRWHGGGAITSIFKWGCGGGIHHYLGISLKGRAFRSNLF